MHLRIPCHIMKAVRERTAEVTLECGFVARLEHRDALDHLDQHFLDDVAGVDGAARRPGQPPARPAMEPWIVACTEIFQSIRVARLRTHQELERRFVFFHAAGQVVEGLPLC
jgi:hypothetical protein